MTTKDWKWCTYSWFNIKSPQYIGKAFDITKAHCYIKYTEGQHYGLEPWDNSYVAFFDTLEECIYYMQTNSDLRTFEIQEMAYDKFRKEAKNVRWDDWEGVLRCIKLKKVMNNMPK